jgi:hypothetical protein
MALTPSKGFWDLQSQINRTFNDMFGSLLRRPEGLPQTQLTEWAPAVDVLSEGGDLVIRAEPPGLKQEDVDITLQDNVLTISGERKAEREEERSGYYVRERRYGWRGGMRKGGCASARSTGAWADRGEPTSPRRGRPTHRASTSKKAGLPDSPLCSIPPTTSSLRPSRTGRP